MSDYRDYLDKQLEDADFRDEWEKSKMEYASARKRVESENEKFSSSFVDESVIHQDRREPHLRTDY